MKEITRIHIAKTPYDIELAAKKALESYMKSLEVYSGDKEIIDDVEIRITEILAERGVQKGGVIANADVEALKSQLGEPREFMGEDGAVPEGVEGAESGDNRPRKLYRDLDHRVLGGVLSGIAAFFTISPAWVRVLFIILALASFGTALLVYVVLWIAVPPARTATDKLQMTGRPVTVQAIREMNESEVVKPTGNTSARRVLTALLGVGCIVGAIGASILTVFAILALALDGHERITDVITGSGYLLAAYILAIISGLLLVTLFILGAYASFAQKMTRRVLISLCTVIVLGLVSFGTAIGLGQYGGWEVQRSIQENTRETVLPLPGNVAEVSALSVQTSHVRVQYIVSDGAPSATLRAVAKDTSSMPTVSTSLENGMLVIESKEQDEKCTLVWGCGITAPTVIIRGPELAKLTAGDNSSVEYQTDSQPELSVNGDKSSNIRLTSGIVERLTVAVSENTRLSADMMTVTNVVIEASNDSRLSFGTIKTLELNDENSCPAGSMTRLDVWNISSPTITVNDQTYPTEENRLACMRLDIEESSEHDRG